MFMETTKVEDTKTAAEVQQLLAARGAKCIMVEYSTGKVEGISFMFGVGDIDVPFKLPCRWRAVELLLKKSGRRVARHDTYEMWARRVAWRQIKRWVESQLALIETGMVKTEEVFLPYATIGSNGEQKTVFELMEARKFLLSPSPEEPKL